MPIIPASYKFENSTIETAKSHEIITPDTPQLRVSQKVNSAGVHTFLMPAYKVDSFGEGVWFKKVNVRSNLGIGASSISYVVLNESQDPANFFANRYKNLFPEEAKPKIREGSKYASGPAYGRASAKVAFNVLEFDFDKNARVRECVKNGGPVSQVLLLPAQQGASEIEKYHNTPDMYGNKRQIVSDYTNATPIFVQCTGGSPAWTVRMSEANKRPIPEELVDSDRLINLDEIWVTPPSQERIIDILQTSFTSQEFEACMNGSPFVKRQVQGVTFTPPATAFPVAPVTVFKPVNAAPAAVPVTFEVEASSNPMAKAAKPKSAQELNDYLKQP